MRSFEIRDMSGKGFVRAMPVEVRGLAVRYSSRRGHAVLQAWIQWDQPDVDSADSWLEIAEVPRGLLKDFLRRYWFCISCILTLVKHEVAGPYQLHIASPWTASEAIIPWPGHPNYIQLPTDWWWQHIPETEAERLVLELPGQHRDNFVTEKVRLECKQAEQWAQDFLDNLLAQNASKLQAV